MNVCILEVVKGRALEEGISNVYNALLKNDMMHLHPQASAMFLTHVSTSALYLRLGDLQYCLIQNLSYMCLTHFCDSGKLRNPTKHALSITKFGP